MVDEFHAENLDALTDVITPRQYLRLASTTTRQYVHTYQDTYREHLTYQMDKVPGTSRPMCWYVP
jgi:hypothetical protein